MPTSVGLLDTLMRLFDFLLSSFLLLSPMLLLGLFLAGVIHVLISKAAVLRWLSTDSLKSVCISSAVGVPIPLCSCSVVPVVREMRNKGASRSSCISFLITAPETGADSILVTHAFFGFVAAVVRPVVSFVTAVVTGIFCIGLIREDSHAPRPGISGKHDHDGDERPDEHAACDDDHDHEHDHDHDHEHDHGTHTPLMTASEDCYVSPSQLKAMVLQWVPSFASRTVRRLAGVRAASWVKPSFYLRTGKESADTQADNDAPPSRGEDVPSFGKVLRHVFRYGFVEVADDILFALVIGILLGGVLFLAIPDGLMTSEYARWISYPVMVIVGIPLYICASASTPIAAALVAKGLSPGAALIFLMTGPATNSGTIAIIISQFGARFASIYVFGVIAVTTVIGILIDLVLIGLGLTLPVTLSSSDSPAIQLVEWTAAIALLSLIIWRFRAGAMKSGYQDLVSNLAPLLLRCRTAWESYRGAAALLAARLPGWMRTKAMLGIALALLYLATGLTIVGPSSVGYSRLFGRVVFRDVPPGLRFLGPWPFFKADQWPVRQVKSLVNATEYEFLSGDLNIVRLLVSLQYRVDDPYTYHYRIQDPVSAIMDDLKDELRTFVSVRSLDQLLNLDRAELESAVKALLTSEIEADPALESIRVIKVNLLEIHPALETMGAFREISSAQDDKERIIANAQKFLVTLIPRAHGNAAYELGQAEGTAFRNRTGAAAESEAIQAVADAARTAPTVLYNMLWREKLEAALAGKAKTIVPNRQSLDRVSVWKRSSNGEVPLPPPVQEHIR